MTPTLTATLPTSARVDETSLSLVVLAGPPGVTPGRRVALDGPPWVVGREPGEPERALALSDGRVSRRHASIGPDPEHPDWVVVRDLGSKNGTFVDGRRAVCAFVAGGEVLRLGETLLYVDADARPASEPGATASALVGPSRGLAMLRREIDAAARGSLPVLVLGETGVGKELVARELHARSGRPGPFRAVNCAAIPRDLAESTLFGHRRGAFTGATEASAGLLRGATGGTLLLDEVGELEPALQAKLLRALEEGAVLPVGAAVPVAIDVRFVAATNRDLVAAAAAAEFRNDLLARLAGVVLRVPPLRERPDDVVALLAHFRGVDPARLADVYDADVLEALALYDWPRNVRELELLVRRLEGLGRLVTTGDLEPSLVSAFERARGEPAQDASHATRGACPTRAELERALAECDGNLAEVGRRFGRDRRQVYRWLERYGLPRAYVSTCADPSSPADRGSRSRACDRAIPTGRAPR